MRIGWGKLAALPLAILLLAPFMMRAWPEQFRTRAPVPELTTLANAQGGFVHANLVPWQQGLTEVPMLTGGRSASGARGTILQEWPGFHAEASFRGEAVSIRFEDGTNRWRVVLDDGKSGIVELARPGMRDLRIRGLTPGPHRLRVEKISESSMPASFGGIWVGEDAAPLPAPAPLPRLIEFIGDSDTVGFASTSSARDCTEDEIYATTDTSRAYAPQVAAALGADFRIIARSGIGLVRNHGGAAPQATMMSRYALALPSIPSAARMAERKPDLVVIALGPSDFDTALGEDERWSDQDQLSNDFGAALIAFLRHRAHDYPDARLILLAFPEYGEPLLRPYREAADTLEADGVRVSLIVPPALSRNACSWHPSAVDHKLIAEQLISAIRGPP